MKMVLCNDNEMGHHVLPSHCIVSRKLSVWTSSSVRFARERGRETDIVRLNLNPTEPEPD